MSITRRKINKLTSQSVWLGTCLKTKTAVKGSDETMVPLCVLFTTATFDAADWTPLTSFPRRLCLIAKALPFQNPATYLPALNPWHAYQTSLSEWHAHFLPLGQLQSDIPDINTFPLLWAHSSVREECKHTFITTGCCVSLTPMLRSVHRAN